MDRNQGTMSSGTMKAWKRGVVPTICFAVVGIVLWSLRRVLGWGFMAVFAGVPFSLQQCAMGTVGFWPRGPRFVLLAVLWAIGMQVLWFPYWAVVWKRPLSRRMRILLVGGACLALVVVNLALAIMSAGAPAV